MIYPHQQKAIEFITEKFKQDDSILALLVSGSIPHGFNDEHSDVDLNIIVSVDDYEKRYKENQLTYWESAEEFYKGGYFDGKFITFDYLTLVAERGSEPTRFALHDVIIAFDKTGLVADHIKKIGIYDTVNIKENTIRFLSQVDIWAWYCGEAMKKNDRYLLDLSVSKLILFSARLILLENKKFFPYHKWLFKVLESCENKPEELLPVMNRLLEDKTPNNIRGLYEMIKGYKDWAGGESYNCSSHFLHDVETVWMRQEEFIENI